jgi:hypothetical protein
MWRESRVSRANEGSHSRDTRGGGIVKSQEVCQRTILLIACFSCATSIAQEAEQANSQAQAGARSDNAPTLSSSDWQFYVSPYLWFSGIHGKVGAAGRDISVHAGFGDIFSNLNFGLMALSELRHKKILLVTDLMWIKLSDEKALPENFLGQISAKAKTQNFMLGPEVGYRVLEKPKLNLDAFTGFRYWHLGSSLEIRPSLFRISTSQNWVDPLVGARIQTPLSSKLRATVLGNVGGFGVGAELEWQVAGLLGYQIKNRFTLQAGYRYLDVNYRSGGFKYDVAMNGLLLGATIRIK